MPFPSRTLGPADPQGDDALRLLREAAVEARALYPEQHTDGAAWPSNEPTPAGGIYLLAYQDGVAVASGALRPFDRTVVEVRRMFVSRSVRRSGIAREILEALEREAAQRGYTAMRLETGDRQTAAMALYAACGFERIAPFGPHASDPTSVCYEKRVAPRAES